MPSGRMPFNKKPMLLDIEKLTVSFRKKGRTVPILSDLSLEVRKGEVLGLVGESGCGKSMTALSIMGLLPAGADAKGDIFFYPDGGSRINLLGLEKPELQRIRGRNIGMVFQEPMTSLNPVFTIGYQIEEAIITHEGITRKEAYNRAIELLRLVKIPSPELRIKDYPHQFSGGMRQRVMIAMAVSCNPSLLIADEPTTALDVTIQAGILRLLFDIKSQKGMSILFITHDLAVISENADRVAIMYAGRIVENTTVEAIFNTPAHPYTVGLLKSLPVARGIKLTPVPGSVPSLEEMPSGCKFSPRCGFRVSECDLMEPALREIGEGHLVRCIRAEEVIR